jgi:hypothetical protein
MSEDGNFVMPLTAEQRQAIRDQARAACDAMDEAAAAIFETGVTLAAEDDAALGRAVELAGEYRKITELLEKLDHAVNREAA